MSKQVLISKKQRELLLSSATIKQKEFVDLYRHLTRHEMVTFHDLKKYTHLKNLTAYLDELLHSSSSEWFPSPTMPVFDLGPEYRKAKVACDLCGHKYIKLQFRIHNHILKKEMVIGSECIKEFGDKLDHSFGSNSKDIQRAANRLFLENEFPGIRNYLENKSIIHSYGMVVPKKQVVHWKQLREKLYQAHSNYVSGKERNLLLIRSLWKEKQLLDQEILTYIEDNKDKPFAVTGELQKWLLRYQSEDFMNELQENNGFITISNIHKVHEPQFMQHALEKTAKELLQHGIKLQNVSPDTKRVDLEFKKDKKTLIGHLPYFTLMKEIAGILFSSPTPNLSFDFILEKSTVISTSALMNWMKLQLDYLEYKVIFEKDKEYVFSKGNDFYLATIKDTVQKHKINFFAVQPKQQIDAWVKSLKRMNQKEYRVYKELKNEMQYK